MRLTVLTMTTSAVALLGLAACSSQTPSQTAQKDSGRTLPQHLVLTGIVQGTLTRGMNAQGVIHAEPKPQTGEDALFTQTSCADYKLGEDEAPNQGTHEWEADVYGKIGDQQITVRFTLEGDAPIPGDHPLKGGTQDHSAVQAYLDTTANHDLQYPLYGSTIHIDPGEHSGTVTLALSNTPQAGEVKERITGAWRCA